MHLNTTTVVALLLATLLVSCTGTASRSAADTEAAASKPREFVVPPPPSLLQGDGVVEYLSQHYWDNMDFTDTGWLADTTALEQVYVEWLTLLQYLPAEESAERACSLLRRVASYPDFLQRFLELSETWLFTPGTQLYDEERYIPLLETVLTLPDVDEIFKLRPREQLAQALKNRLGTRAADLPYTTSSGRKGRLYDMRGEYTMLMFYAPDCPTCAAWEEYASGSEFLKSLLSSGRLSVLAVCANCDEELWRSRLSQMPAGWTVGRWEIPDEMESPYYVVGTPNLYLLDREKRVVMKNRTIFEVEAWLAEHTAAAQDESATTASNR